VVKGVIDDLLRGGLLRRTGEPGRPVLALSELGEELAEDVDLDEIRVAPPAAPAPPPSSRAPAPPARAHDIRQAVLRCIAALPTALGASKVAAILTGSRAKWIEPIGAAELDVYGVLGESQDRVRDEIALMLEEGLLRQGGSDRYPVLQLTEAGEEEATDSETSAWEPQVVPEPEWVQDSCAEESEPWPEPEPEYHEPWPEPDDQAQGPADTLDGLVRHVLDVDADEAKLALPQLRLFHPQEIVQRLESSFSPSERGRAQARAVWLAGELGEHYAISFLIRCASTEDGDVRRLTASALGKVATAVRARSSSATESLASAQRTLLELAEDSVSEVAQYARRSLRDILGASES